MLPNIISVLRVLLTPAVIILLMQREPAAFWGAITLFTIAALTDFWDGQLARKWGVSSALGAFIDPLADKILVLGVLAALVHESILSIGLFFIFAGRDFFLTALRSVVASNGLVWRTSQLAKWKTFLQFIVLYGGFGVMAARVGIISLPVHVVQHIFLAIVWPIALLTLYSALDYLVTYRLSLESLIIRASLPAAMDNFFVGCATLGLAWLRLPAPGTIASIMATFVAYTFSIQGPWTGLMVGALLIGGWIAATRASYILREDDPGVVVIDEVVAMLFICLFVVPQVWWMYALACGIFRVIDIAKPYPISLLEKNIKGGLGIMLDDLAAAGLTIFILRIVSICFGLC